MDTSSPKPTSLIDQAGLSEVVWFMYIKEGRTPVFIRDWLLKEHKMKVSRQLVLRWLRTQTVKRSREIDSILTDHLHKHLPEDLSALEEIEIRSLLNSKLEIDFKSHEMAGNAKFLDHFKKLWAQRIALSVADDDTKMLDAIAREIYQQVFKWTLESIDWMKNMREERRVALATIDTKLKYATQLHGSHGARINIYRAGMSPDQDDEGQKKEPAPVEVKSGSGKVISISRERDQCQPPS